MIVGRVTGRASGIGFALTLAGPSRRLALCDADRLRLGVHI